jgi:hypothetical protein
MLEKDFAIQSNLRRMLVRTSINYSRMDFGTVKGVVYIRGIFQLSYISPDTDEDQLQELTAKTLYSFEKKVRNIPGVTDVMFQLQNWRKEKGQWVQIEAKKKEEADENKAESSS